MSGLGQRSVLQPYLLIQDGPLHGSQTSSLVLSWMTLPGFSVASLYSSQGPGELAAVPHHCDLFAGHVFFAAIPFSSLPTLSYTVSGGLPQCLGYGSWQL